MLYLKVSIATLLILSFLCLSDRSSRRDLASWRLVFLVAVFWAVLLPIGAIVRALKKPSGGLRTVWVLLFSIG
jgi:hypothetical protein